MKNIGNVNSKGINRYVALSLMLVGVLWACQSKHSDLNKNNKMEKLTETVYTCNLKNDPEVIAKYKHLHSAEGMWPEVKKTFEATGAKSVKIYIQDTRLVLIIALPESVSQEDFQRKYDSTSPRIKEWDELMASFQVAPPGGNPDGTWVTMDLMFDFKSGDSE